MEKLFHLAKDEQGDEAWAQIVGHYRGQLAGFVRARLSQRLREFVDVEDIVQRTLVTCWDKLPEYEYNPDKSRFRTWICSIARNYTLKFFRDSGRYQDKLDNFQDLENGLREPEVNKLAEKEWKLYISNLAWENIKNEFEGNALDCFIMMSDGLSAALVAEKLGLTVGSVYILKKRVTDKLYREINRLDRELN